MYSDAVHPIALNSSSKDEFCVKVTIKWINYTQK